MTLNDMSREYYLISLTSLGEYSELQTPTPVRGWVRGKNINAVTGETHTCLSVICRALLCIWILNIDININR